MKACIVKASAVLAAAAAVLTGCASGTVINTDESPQHSPTSSATPPPPPVNTANLVDATDYMVQVDGRNAYYFSTPSGRWQCAILPRDRAGCESANGLTAGIGITGQPDVMVDGEATTPNAIVVDRENDATFVVLPQSQFATDSAKALPFGKVLAVAGFRCNVQEESGVSCLRELSGKGFTFSADGYTLQYTEVP
ncbi:hypothetical protein M1247_15345 [Mycobacterium sp. 21AC1]|uniref:hypothetical protein n=1 Tax=[Mycobacterium] appelbergii TaxID=2939269 RepID=UPI0029392F80|nr:hypothetical protein [Mycobacterium sp. 21AC1]MDV3126296.1 hypothetical protein [Mycobacterium sp. 21AC1]